MIKTGAWLMAGVLVAGVLGAVAGVRAEGLEEAADLRVREAGYGLEVLASEPESEVVVRLRVTDLAVRTIQIDGVTYSLIELHEAGTTHAPGQPVLPVISRPYRISDTREPLVEVVPLATREIQLAAPLLPSQEREIEDIVQIGRVDQAVYAADSVFPAEPLWWGQPEILRDLRILQVSYCPFRYYPASGRLVVIEEAELRITAGGPSTENVKTGPRLPITASWGDLYRAVVPNYDDRETDRGAREHYLVIYPDAAASAIDEWCDWKEAEGFVVERVPTSQTGTSASAVRQKILTQYGGTERPTYVLLVGDESYISVSTSYDGTTYGSQHPGWYTDESYFSKLEGSDYIPDIFVGRLPASSTTQITTMLVRALYWETTPNTTDHYYGKGLATCSGLYASQRTVKEQTAERWRRMHDFQNTYELYNWSYSTLNTVKNYINAGLSVINYRGEGWQSGWTPMHAYSFDDDDVDTLTNTNRPLVLTSIGCGVCMFTGGRCFGEAWMRLGSSTQIRGAVTVLGPSWNTHTTFNNWMDRGIYRGLAYDDLYATSQAYLAGKFYMRDHFPDPYLDEVNQLQFQEFLQLGTPDTKWRTIDPDPPALGFGYAVDSMDRYLALRTAENWTAVGAKVVVNPGTADADYLILGTKGEALLDLPAGTTSVPVSYSGYNMVPGQATVTLDGATGLVIITEVKPNVPTDGAQGDIVELFNFDSVPVDLRNMILTDLDMMDIPITSQSVVLQPGQFAVVHFVGPRGEESIVSRSYGWEIESRAYPDFSSEEDQCVLRDATGKALDGLAWHNGTGISDLDNASDISRLTGAGTPFTMGPHAWWEGPNWIHADDYEQYTIDWSDYAGTEGPASIQRVIYPGTAGPPDSPAHFEVRAAPNWGEHSAPPLTPTPGPTVDPTVTPTPGPDTPTATPSPTLTPTPPAGDYLTTRLELNSQLFTPGAPFILKLFADRSGPGLMVEHYVILDVWGGAFFFWPSWTESADYQLVFYGNGDHIQRTLLEFTWPSGAGTATGLRIWTACLYPGTADLATGVMNVEFAFTE